LIPPHTTLLLTCHPCTLAKREGMLHPGLAMEEKVTKSLGKEEWLI
jgi:hypothetical protein